MLPRGDPAPPVFPGVRSPAIAESQSGAGTDGGRDIQPRLELSESFVELTRSKVGDAEVNEDGGRGWQERDRALQARARPGQIPLLTQSGSKKRMADARRGIEGDALPQLGHGPVLRSAVPKRDAEAVVGLGRFGPECNRSLQVRDRGGQISLLAQNETEQAVRLRVVFVEAEGVGELFAGGAQFATRQRPPAPRLERSSAGLGADGRGLRKDALCCFSASPSP